MTGDERPSRMVEARRLAEEAFAEQRAGHADLADRLMAQAQRISAEAVIAVLEEHAGDLPSRG